MQTMNERIKSIAEAATFLFLQQGYSKTQISHIAKAVGISVGTIYLDFTGKKGILNFIRKGTISPGFFEKEFERTITDDLFVGLEDEIAGVFEQTEKAFAKNLKNAPGGYPFEALISDAFDLLAKYAAGCLFIEKNQFDFKELAEHYKRYRKGFFETIL